MWGIQPCRIGSGDHNNTTTLMETLKRRARDCGVDITDKSTAAETRKKRACRRKDFGGDTSTAMETYGRRDCGVDTPTVMETKKKRAYKRNDCGGDTTNTTTVMQSKKRKDCDGTDTPTVVEKKKRPYRRKDCEGDTTNNTTVMQSKKRKDCCDTNTSAVMETKKRECRRKDVGDTNTPTMMEKKKKKRPYRRKYCEGDTTNTTTVTEKKKRPYRRKKCLPHDLIMEEILTRLPVPELLKSVRVSKLWYNSIHNDRKRFAYAHFLQSQKHPDIIFSLLNVRDGVVRETGEPMYGCHFFKFTDGLYSHINAHKFYKCHGGLADRDMFELVGYCRGIPCVAHVGNYSTGYTVLDPNTRDFLYFYYPAIIGKRISKAHIICHGFGFDPSTNEYKLVSFFGTNEKELNAVVFTLGTKSWRNVTATSTPISGLGGRPVLKIRTPTGTDKSAILCTTSSSGCLVWKIITTLGGEGSDGDVNNNEMEMLLWFNLHDEKFQFIQLPAKSTTDEQHKHALVDYPHLLEFKGSPCIARIEKISRNGSDYPHRCCDDHQGSSSCCCCCKVHLYMLKDKVKPVWVKEESFDVCINSNSRWLRVMFPLSTDPCLFCFGNGTTLPPTRIFSFSDQMLLYWFNGDYLQLYNLRSKSLLHVLPTDRVEDVIFRAKMEEPQHIYNSGNDDDNYSSNMDYQLHRHEENFLSLETFIPEGAAGVDALEFIDLDLTRQERPCSGFAYIYRGSKVFYPFYN